MFGPQGRNSGQLVSLSFKEVHPIFDTMRNFYLTYIPLLFLSGCVDQTSPAIHASFSAYCEQVANDAKPIALNPPMTKEEVDTYWDFFQKEAAKFGVKLYRDQDFPVTSLFPASVTDGLEVVVIYRGSRLTQYQQLKADLSEISPDQAARRLGRLLGYSPQGINELLLKHTEFRTLTSFDVKEQITHLYYEDLTQAIAFYKDVLGLEPLTDTRFLIGEDASISLHAFNEEHPKGQPQSTAIALLTDQLPQWYTHIQELGVPLKYTYKPREGGPHDGFVAIDPGGYLLEFEQFKQHPENELFMAVLQDAPRIATSIDGLNFYGSITWTYHNDLLKMQQFYEEVLGYVMVADQGWTKIYQTSPSGFIGLVDERRGMMDYADEKAIEIEWRLEDQESATNYYTQKSGWTSAGRWLEGPEKYRYLLR